VVSEALTEKEIGRKRLFSQPFSYSILFQYVLLHLGQGGNLSESSSSLITSSHLVHLYRPFPGFSPVRYIAFQFLKIKQLFSRFTFVHGRSFTPVIFHVGPDPFFFPVCSSLSCGSVANDVHVTKIFALPMLLYPSLRIIGNPDIKEGVPVLQLILIGLSSTHNNTLYNNETSQLFINRLLKKFVMTKY
jgi:hypothetical protein